MKTSFDISDALLAEARAFAKERNTTVTALVERGLRAQIEESKKRNFKLKLIASKKVELPGQWESGDWSGFRDEPMDEKGHLYRESER